ncbi:MAG: ABC transporter permease [Treponema sp.]|nr:ABC transporter permease [Treponema sp.]
MKKFFLSLLPFIFGTAICILIVILFASRPAESLRILFTGNFTSTYYFGSMLNTASFLMIAGAGAAFSIRGGNMNLSGEGQVYLGGFIAGLVLSSSWTVPPFIQFCTALLLCVASGIVAASVSALLKEMRNAEVLLTSFLLSAALIPIIDSLITAINGKSGQNLLALPYINEAFCMKAILPPSSLNMSFFIAVFICIILALILEKTSSGRKIAIWGKAPLFAQYSGCSSKANSFFTLAVSGALHALTGFFAVCGTYFTCHKGFYAGMGWNALSTALIARSNPLLVIPVSLALACLYPSADCIGLTQGFAFDISAILQGFILFAISVPVVISSVKKSGGKK